MMVRGRTVREVHFQGAEIGRIGQFPAFDYFQDGSLYLLDTPGHCVAHLCALVRTTANPDTFVFLGGDAAHHCGEVRPSAYVPMPESITSLTPTTHLDQHPTSTASSNGPICPCSWFEELQISRNRDPNGPLWQPAFGHNIKEVLTTIEGMQEYDGDDNVFVILAHDSSLRSPEVPFFPAQVNDWKQRGLGQKLKWVWTEEILAAIKA
jgi:glyoxylase-like metal-dependent hydrolase (beta-lactamase superfamily II)